MKPHYVFNETQLREENDPRKLSQITEFERGEEITMPFVRSMPDTLAADLQFEHNERRFSLIDLGCTGSAQKRMPLSSR
jgi:hypothetical protein